MPGPGADLLSGPSSGAGSGIGTTEDPSSAPAPDPAGPAGPPAPRVVGPRRWGEIEPATAYAIARLRVDVFVVEQACPYPELDGRDLEPDAGHLWAAEASGAVLAYLRVLAEPDGSRRVGRVVTAATARGRGLGAELVAAVVADHGGGPIVLDAQSHLQGWYARFGFAPDGPGFVEDGIPHVPMRRPATPPPSPTALGRPSAVGATRPPALGRPSAEGGNRGVGQASPATSSASSVRRPV